MIKSQFELILNGMVNGVTRYAKYFFTDKENKEIVQRAVATIVELANAERTTDRLFVEEKGGLAQYQVSDYKAPGYNWGSGIIDYSHRVGKTKNLVDVGRYCIKSNRPKWMTVTKTVGEGETAKVSTSELKPKIYNPTEFEIFWNKVKKIDRFYETMDKEISKTSHTIEDMAGFYDFSVLTGKELSETAIEEGRLRTYDISADGVSLEKVEFFLLSSIKSYEDETFSTYGLTDSLLESWLTQPTGSAPNTTVADTDSNK